METKPYIGITGFTSTTEVAAAADAAERAGTEDAGRAVMYGIITSDHIFDRPSERGRIRAALNDLESLVSAVPGNGIAAIHHHTPYAGKLAEELTKVLDRSYNAGARLVQINTTWPSPAVMQDLKERFPGTGFVLQFPPEALASGPEGIASRASEYAGLASYTLVDPSQGAGIGFDPVLAAEIMSAVSERLPDTIMGVAGGLSGKNVVSQVASVRELYKEPFIIDAEGRLRTEDWRHIDSDRTEAYLRGAVEAFR